MYLKLLSELPVSAHTDYIIEGSTFVAINGSKLNGIDFISEALAKGAKKIIVQKNSIIPSNTLKHINLKNADLIEVDDCRLELAKLSAKAFDYPSRKLKILGITGTKGKTTCTFLMYHLLTLAGYKTAMISGIYNVINGQQYESFLTTPLPDYLHAFFYECYKQKIEYVVMEASAQAFSLKRLYGIEFSGAIFTNLDSEHMEFYRDMNEYFQAKNEIFKQMQPNAPIIINSDNIWSEQIDKSKINFKEISFFKNCKYFAKILQDDFKGLNLKINVEQNSYNFNSSLIGQFNAYNIVCTVALALELKIDPCIISEAIQQFDYVPGRMERYHLSNGALAVIDYAHNPSSFSNVLPTLKSIAKKLIVVFGAGGDRDKTKRPIMGNIASKIADHVIITSDNPRSENVQDIITQILSGIDKFNLNKVKCEINRAQAIEHAYRLSNAGDIIAILGKGPDEYEIIGNTKIYFSDKQTILNCK